MVANLGCRKHPLLSAEIGADRGEDFWWHPNGDIERIREVPCMDEQIFDVFLVFSNLESEL